ncbi:MAG: S-layer homology domain-containing protein [Clostridia bacterium]|nr:S-layer homology domain-containing protein [Clostridia bacterium]
MKKRLKQIFSLFISFVMTFSLLPGVLAAGETLEEIVADDISKLPYGNSSGRLIMQGMTVGYGNGEEMYNAKYLVDGFHFSTPEMIRYGEIDTTADTSSITLNTPDGNTKTTGTVSLDESNNTIEIAWPEKKSVKRLEMWVWPVGAIKDYEVYYYADSEWINCAEGTLDQSQVIPETDTRIGVSAVSYIITFPAVETAKIRFVAKSFRQGLTSAKVAEIVPRSSDEVNLLEAYTVTKAGTNGGWLDSANGSKNPAENSHATPYSLKFGCSKLAHSDTWSFTTNNGTTTPSWPLRYTTTPYGNGNVGIKNDKYFWYGLSFNNSPQKINKIKFGVSGADSAVTQFEIWCSTDDEIQWRAHNAAPSGGKWKKMITVDGTFEAGSSPVAYLPNSIHAEHWMIKITKWTGTPQMTKASMYVVDDVESFPDVFKAANTVFDDVVTDTDDSSVVNYTISNLFDEYTDEKGNEYTVSWSFDEEKEYLVKTESGQFKIDFHDNEEKLNVYAKLTPKADPSVSCTAIKEFTLLPIFNEATVEFNNISLEDGANDTLLKDYFYFSPYDIEKNPSVTPELNPEKLAKIEGEEAYIEYKWVSPEKMSHIDLWAYPHGALKDYKLEFSNDGIDYTEIDSITGSFDEIAAEEDSYINAAYYPINFDEMEVKYLRVSLNLNEGYEEAYLSEARVEKTSDINLLDTSIGDDEEFNNYSHYMQGYIVSSVADDNTKYLKDKKAVYPMRADGTSPEIIPNGGVCWYATSFSIPAVNFNRVVVPLTSGTAKEVEILCAAGDESGFDFESELPASPDTLTEWKSIVAVRGNFNSSTPAVIDISEAVNSKYWMVKVKNCSGDMTLGKVSFNIVDASAVSKGYSAAETIFDSLTTDLGSTNEAKNKINLFDSYEYEEKTYSVTWESTSKLLDLTTGNISAHDNHDKTTLTALVTDSDNPSVAYSVSKEYKLIGMRNVYHVSEDGTKTGDNGILTDEFHYLGIESSAISEPKAAIFNLDKFIGLGVGESIEVNWGNPDTFTRFEMWAWPIDAIKSYEIQTSADGIVWNKHYEGTIIDQFAKNPQSRPIDTSDESAYALFYNIVFDKPAKNVKYMRFKVTGLREGVEKAYLAEAMFGKTNDVNFLARDTIKGSEKANKSNSKYTLGFRISNNNANNGAYSKHTSQTWPMYSDGSSITLAAGSDGYIWYGIQFQRAPVAINKVSLNVSAGTVYEYEVLYADTYSFNARDAGFEWADFMTDPALLKDYHSVAKVSGVFNNKSGASVIHFENTAPGKYWLIRVNRATEDARISGIGLYQISHDELSTSCYNVVLDHLFENVSDTALPNIVKDKLNIPSTVSIDANGDGTPEEYEITWSDDKGLVNDVDGTFDIGNEDVEIELTAKIGLSSENYKHVRRMKFTLLGKDDRERTTIFNRNNIALSENAEENCDIIVGNGFEYSGKKKVEIDFAQTPQNGKMQLMSGNSLLAEIPVVNGKIVLNSEEIALDSKILFEIEGDKFSVYKHNGVTYATQVYKQSLLEDYPFNKIRFVTGLAETLSINNVSVSVISSDFFASIAQQFDFSKICSTYKATNLNGNFEFFEQVGDIVLTLTSADSSVVAIDNVNNTATVNTAVVGSTTLTATLTSSTTGETHTEAFKVLTGRNNVAAKAKSSSPAVVLDGYSGVYALDGSLESEFLTDARGWRVNINLMSEQPFNKFCFYLPEEATGTIQEFKLLKSNDNIDYTEIYHGTNIEDKEDIVVPYTKAQFIRIEVVSTSGGNTGIKDICMYYEMSDEEKQEYDFNQLTEGLTVKNGTTIPKKGYFGTDFTVTSNDSVVSIEETKDHNSWKVVVGDSNKEKTVTITLAAKYGSNAPITKSYDILVMADINIGGGSLPGTNNNGFGGSSGGGGGGTTSGKDDKPTVTPPTTSKPVVELTDDIAELNKHWGANEIKSLIAMGVVTGDGNSLQLTKKVTRAEFCKMIVAGFGIELPEYKGSFSDVKESDWFAPYAEGALKNNIMAGSNGAFRGKDEITRQEMAVVLMNVLKNYIKLPEEVESEEKINFTDSTSIATWAEEAIEFAASLGVLKGYETGEFKPSNSLKRDEAMVVVYRALSHIKK